MPIHCAASMVSGSQDDFRDIDYRVMRNVFDSQNQLGRLADERIYQADLAARLRAEGVDVRQEVEVELSYLDYHKSLFLDLLVAEIAVYELKAVESLNRAHVAQLLTYLYLLDASHGKLINFRAARVESKFVNATHRIRERRAFGVVDEEFCGHDDFRELVLGMVRDWGTSLSGTIYEDAIVGLLGGRGVVEIMHPLVRNGIALGTQRFRLAGPNIGFKITTMNKERTAYRSQLTKLLRFSSLKAVHWVNIARHELTLITLKAN